MKNAMKQKRLYKYLKLFEVTKKMRADFGKYEKVVEELEELEQK